MTTFVSVDKLGMSSSPALDSISYMLVVVPIGSTVVTSATSADCVEPSSSKDSPSVDDVVEDVVSSFGEDFE